MSLAKCNVEALVGTCSVVMKTAEKTHLYFSFNTQNIQTVVFITIFTTFWLIYPLALFRCFILISGANTAPQTEPFIQSMGIDCSHFINHNWVQVSNCCKYSFLFLPLVGIEPATSWWFHPKACFNQIPYPLFHVSYQTYQLKLYEYNNEYEDNNPNILSYKNSAPKFRQIFILL